MNEKIGGRHLYLLRSGNADVSVMKMNKNHENAVISLCFCTK